MFRILPKGLRKMEQMLPERGTLWPGALPRQTTPLAVSPTNELPKAHVAFFAGALFAATAVLVVAGTLAEPVWLRAVAVLVAGTCALRAILAPLGVSALDALAPLAFVALILLLSIRVLAGAGGGRVGPAEDPA